MRAWPRLFWFGAFLVAVPLLLDGCGGSSKSANRDSTSRSGSVSNKGTISEQTRAATINKRGAWSLTSEKVKDVARLVEDASKQNRLPEDLIYGIIWVESRFNPKATSPVGARGLMQLMPKTADYLADCIEWRGRNNSFNPEFNVAAGSYYIARLIKEFNGDQDLALAAYNAGPTKVRQWLKRSGLPKVSIEYATMVQTARTFFGSKGSRTYTPGAPALQPSAEPVITDDELDRLGLAILIAGLNDKQFGLEREDDANPFD